MPCYQKCREQAVIRPKPMPLRYQKWSELASDIFDNWLLYELFEYNIQNFVYYMHF